MQNDLEIGEVVVITAPDFFKGKKIAVYLRKCKDHDNGIECNLIDPNSPIKKICVNPQKRGDSLSRLKTLVVS